MVLIYLYYRRTRLRVLYSKDCELNNIFFIFYPTNRCFMSKNFPYFSSKFSVIIYIFPLSAHIAGSHPNNIATLASRWQDNELEDWGRKGTKQLRINSVESASSGRNSFAVTEVAVAVTSRLHLRPSHHPLSVTHCVYVMFFSMILFSPLLVVPASNIFSHTILNISCCPML